MASRKQKSSIKKPKASSKPADLPPVGGDKSKDFSGMMFIKHLPPGLLEKQLTEFFRQFGVVKRVFLAKSERTKKSRGYGYVEFLYEDVAKIAASAINNYFMFGRLLQATVVPKRFSEVPRNLLKGLGKNGQPNENHFEWVRKRIKDYNGFSNIGNQYSLRRNQKLKLQRALKELEQANMEVPAIQDCYVKVLDVFHDSSLKLQTLAPANPAEPAKAAELVEPAHSDEDNSESEEEAFKVFLPSDWVEIDDETDHSNEEGSEAAIQAAIKKANEHAKSLKKSVKKAATVTTSFMKGDGSNDELQVTNVVAVKKDNANAKISKKNNQKSAKEKVSKPVRMPKPYATRKRKYIAME